MLMQRIKNRPMSPDVLDIDGKQLHYKLPIGAISSIANRVTGVGMSVGVPLLVPNVLSVLLVVQQCAHLHGTRFGVSEPDIPRLNIALMNNRKRLFMQV